MRSFIRRVVALSGAPVRAMIEAEDGLQALEVLRRQHVDLVLSDINMPRMNGEELLRRICSDPALSSVPVIVVSTDASQCRTEVMLSLGARGYIKKPFQPEALRAEIERVLEIPA